MRLIGQDRADAPHLLWMTSLSSIDGTIPLLAAQGHFDSPGAAAAIGLTMVAGIGAWIAAWQAFPKRPGRRELAAITAMIAASSALTILAVAAGIRWGHHLHVLPHIVGAVVMLVAAQVAGLRLPRIGHLGPPVLLILAASVVEVALWIP